MEAGLPNITGTVWRSRNNSYASIGGAFYYEMVYDADGTGGSAPTPVMVHMDASRSNSIYGSSSTITPLSLSTKLILKY